METATLTPDQLEVLGALKDVQKGIVRRDTEQAEALAWRAKLVERAKDLGLSQATVADHIDVRPSSLRQAALRDRRRASV